MKTCLTLLLLLSSVALAQKPAAKAAPSATDPSGMYSFLHDGEYVEVDIDGGNVTGFISRYGDSDSDRGAFLDHMFTRGTFDGKNLTFATRAVHGVSFEFKGKLEKGGKKPGAEGYYVIKGTLTQTTVQEDKKAKSNERDVEFKSFPADALSPAGNQG